ncbi:MAG: MBL fold metallo-hydrolase, partial [Bacteroidetes bacterium]|nr:MBL fold metallo-hydrolase [Bacteroidota bacterium]
MNLYHRQQQLTIFGPIGLSEIITLQLRYSQTVLNFKVDFEELNPLEPQVIYENEKIIIKSFPLNHRIHCTGFSFQEKPKKRKLIKEKIDGIPLKDRVILKNGVDIVDDDGKIIYKSDEFTLPAKRSRSYAYCSDTKYDETIVEWIKNVDLLYHEATFLDELIERAEATFHSTAKQAAKIAKKAQVKKLIIGHFSIRYKELHPLLAEAREVFEDTELAIEGESISIEE